ncbi:glycosyltransferase family protein [Aquibacillus rhizosphaerae]|uniref:Glycosyltransferase n=1 Tax=Aquibacillus rhizosphaerae TaxID=3051431 RepID=A0ABT7L3I7_9BACI|nr:glycosyltransferase [Aquibacillus sp. LR5S19]MDL4839767.1 glycosyltransferase [Aquibacillus sp. LR5S19]
MNNIVCFLVTEHPFLDARIFKKEAKSLVKKGYKVTMIVPRKNGYLFDVDGNLFRNEFRDSTFYYEGIKIITYEQINYEQNLKELHYTLLSRGYNRFNDSLTCLGIKQEADFYHTHELFSLYSGIGIKRALTSKGKHCKLIYDSHELEPDPLSNQSNSVKKVKKSMLNIMLRELDFVITVSESIKSWYLSINSTLSVEVIYNSPPLASICESKKGNESSLVLGYEGDIGRNRGTFKKLINVLEMCNKSFYLRAKIIGGCKKSKQDSILEVPSHLRDKISFTGWVDYDSIPLEMKDVDLGWIDLDATNSLNNKYAMPNKFFSYLNNGVPVLVNNCEDMERFILSYNCGYVINKLQASALDYHQALIHLESDRKKINEMSRNAREIMKTEYNWGYMENRLYAVYDQLNNSGA